MAREGRTPLVGGLIGWAVPEVLRNIDTESLLDSIDIGAVVEQLDVDAVAGRLDLDALIGRLDVDAIAGRLDLDALIGRLDVDAIAARLDLDALVGRLDVDVVADRLDLDALMTRIDLTRVMGRGTQEIAEGSLDLVRRQVVRVDSLVNRSVARVLRQDLSARPQGPPTLVAPAAEPVSEAASGAAPEPSARRDVSGHYAGAPSRLAALALDVFASLTLFGFLGAVASYLVHSVLGIDVSVDGSGWIARGLLATWMLVWFWATVALVGRTPAMLLVGLRVVTRSGGAVGAGRALIRAVVEPITTAVVVIGWIGVLVGRERRGLHDVAAGTVVVYDWGPRRAEAPLSLAAQLQDMIRANRT